MSLPSAANPIGSPFVELQSIDSTNKYAMTLVHEGMAQHGMVIFAYEQAAGKGQRGKTWKGEKGANIAMSIIIKPYPLKVSDTFKLSVCASVAINKFLKKYIGDETKIKWPNDMYWRDRKAGGILIENKIKSKGSGIGTWEWSVIGIGININQTLFSPDLPNPVSIKQITGKHFEPVDLAKELCIFLDNKIQMLSSGKSDLLFEDYNLALYKKDESVKLKKGNLIFEAIIKGVTETGQLITQHSVEEEFDFGEIEFVL